MVLVQFEIVVHCLDWFGGVFVKRENFGFSKEMLSKFCQDPCSCFDYRLSYNHPNEVIPIGNHNRYFYKWDQKKIVALRLPNTGLKVSSGSSRVMLCFGHCYRVLVIS